MKFTGERIYAFELFNRSKKPYFLEESDFSKETDFRFKAVMFCGCCRVKPFDIKNNEYLSRIDKECKRRYGKLYEEMIPKLWKMFYSEDLLRYVMNGTVKNEKELKKQIAKERKKDRQYGIIRIFTER